MTKPKVTDKLSIVRENNDEDDNDYKGLACFR